MSSNNSNLPHHPSRAEGSRFHRAEWRDLQRLRNHYARVAAAHTRTEAELDGLRIDMLPCQASDYYADALIRPGWNPVLKTIYQGTRSQNFTSVPLATMRDHENTLIRHMYSFLSHPYSNHVRLTIPADLIGNGYDTYKMRFRRGRGRDAGFHRLMEEVGDSSELTSTNNPTKGFVSFCKVANVTFPEPAGRNVNMMPFILGDQDSLPGDLQCYYPLIDACPFYREEFGKVAYLTIHESFVDQGSSQRRPGLHIESPGVFPDPPSGDDNTNPDAPCSFASGMEHPWGMGVFFGPDRYEGGIYFASNVDDSSQVWDALVDKNVPDIVDHTGGCEHLRPLLGSGTKLRAGEMVWMTDCTPHEALPQPTAGPRQFFRLVMPYISHWYAAHSTPNPKVPLPDSVKVIYQNKFEN